MENNSKKGVQRILARILLGIILVSTLAFVVLAVPFSSTDFVEPTAQCVVEETGTIPEETVVLNDNAITYPELVYEDLGYKYGAVDSYDAIQFYIEEIEAALASDTFTDSAVAVMRSELNRLNDIAELYIADVERFVVYESEYYYAAQVWQTFKAEGYSAAAVAGILGNMMIETSGGSLALKPTIYDPARAYYGLCQWSLYYRPGVADMSFEDQLDYLYEDMPGEFKEFGFCYERDFTYEDFINMESPEDAALAFAKIYERCASGSYELRKQAARKAYNYFVGE